ncbi:MAG: SDR family NAD(P)-dependent oxidoreductase, partial [Chloroflexota bacterium]
MSLTGKKLLVTGAASGIGRAIALQAGKDGAIVIAADLSESGLDALKRELPQAVCVRADVTKVSDVDRMIAAAEGRLDVLCNNAGLMDRHMLVDELPEQEWERVLAVNLTGPFLLCKRAVPLM